VLEVAGRVGQGNIVFEASGLVPTTSRRLLQFWLIRLFGSEVNIGNARIEEMANLEACVPVPTRSSVSATSETTRGCRA